MSSEILLMILRRAETACADEDYVKAESLFSEAITIDDCNPALFGNRSVVRFYLHKFVDALKDAERAVDINPNYAMGYFRLGVAHQCLQRYNVALVAFAKAMSLEPKNFKFLQALIDTALKSPLQDSLKPVLKQLNDMNLERNPFVVISVIGQDLLAHDDAKSAAEILECAITIDTCSLKLKGSVCSALSSALWTLECYERAISYMKEDLKVSQALTDTPGECRAYGNLAAAFFHQNHLQQAHEHYKKQLLIAESLQHEQMVGSANSGLGSVYTSLNQPQNALSHHERAAEIYGELQDNLLRCRELGKVAQARLELGDAQGSLRAEKERIQIASSEIQDGGREEAQAYGDVANVYKALQRNDETIACLQRAADLFKEFDRENETKTLLLLGHAARMAGQYSVALTTYARLLEISLHNSDKLLEGRSCANLGVVHHQMNQYETALKFQTRALRLAEETGDVASQGRAYGNMGNAYSASGLYEQAVEHHLKELEISRSIDDQECECSTLGNLAVAYQALHANDKALSNYKSQLELARQIGDLSNQSRALMNLGNFYNSVNKYEEAIKYYRHYLDLSTDHSKAGGRGRALYNLGFACFSLRDYQQAVDCYEKSVALATECQDRVAMARAYCNLGLARKALGAFDAAIQCQHVFLDLSRELGSVRGELKALGNLGDVAAAKRDFHLASTYYEQQLNLSELHNEALFIAQSCSSLAAALRSIGQLEKASELLAKESEIYRNDLKDAKNEYKAQGKYGATLTSLGRYSDAVTCYRRQLEISHSNGDLPMQTQAWSNIAITQINLLDYKSAKDAFENQIEILEQLESSRAEKCRAHCSIADCCEAMEEHRDALRHNQIALSLACEMKNLSLMERACKGLAASSQHATHPDAALIFSEHRLKICLALERPQLAALAYGDLGYLYSVKKNFSDALHCLNQQMKLAVEMNNESLKSDAACGLGGVYLLMKDYDKALTFHKLDLELAQRNSDRPCQGRAFGNIAATYEAMKEYAAAIPNREQHLFIAKEQDDELAKLVALHGIGRNTLQLPDGDYSRAALLLQQAVLLCHGVSNNEEMVATAHDLGIATWACGNAPTAATHLRKAVEIGETLCYDAYHSLKRDRQADHFIDCYKLLSKCYSSLLCALSHIGDGEAALETAEKFKTFPERLFRCRRDEKMQRALTVKELIDYATKRDCVVVYYVISAGYLFHWVISAHSGVSFVEPTYLGGDVSILSELLSNLRDTLGVADTDDDTDIVQQNVTPKNTEKPLYLQMLAAANLYEYDNAHLSTGKGCLLPVVDDVDKFKHVRSKPAFSALHELLFTKVEKELRSHKQRSDLPRLVVVASGGLLLVPFPMLKKRAIEPYLSEQFVLNVLPSFQQITPSPSKSRFRRCLTIANPLSGEASRNSAAAEGESRIAAAIFAVETTIGLRKRDLLPLLGSSEVLHFACGVSWGPSSGVLLGNSENMSGVGRISPDSPNLFRSAPSEELLTASEIMECDLSATKLVVLGAPYMLNIDKSSSKSSKLGSDFSGFVSCLLARGAGSVLLPLWPVPETASKLLLQTFFKHLAGGRSTAAALAVAMDTVRSDARFEHPSYWAGYVLVGQDVHLAPGDVSLVHAVCELVRGEPALARDTIKLLLHLAGKSLKNIPDEDRNDVPTYTTQESVSDRVRDTRGWRDLFAAAGFQLRPTNGEIPDAIFFPEPGNDPALEKLTQHLAPFLSVSDSIFLCYGKLTSSPCTACTIAAWLSDVLLHLETGDFPQRYELERRLWQTDGASELLKCLGFTLEVVNRSSVFLSLPSPQMEAARAVLACIHFMFGSVRDGSTEADEECSLNGSNVDEEGDESFGLSSIVSGILAEHGMDSTDFNSSFRSAGSTSSSVRLESSTSAGLKDEFGLQPLEEPKVFTQVLKNPDIIAPKPMIAQKSRSSTPTASHSAPVVGFSPSKKFVFASPLGSMLQGDGPQLAGNPQPSPKRSSPSHLTEQLLKPSSDFQSVRTSSDPKICIVSPQRELPQTSKLISPPGPPPTNNRYMAVFENMITNDMPPSSRGQLDLQRTKNGSMEKAELQDPQISSSYKPSPSAASSIRTVSPQREYSHIVDKFTHRVAANQKSKSGSRDEKLQRSNTSSSHTAFRLVNQSDPSAPPKLQKYLVQTHVSTVSTLLSEDAELPGHVKAQVCPPGAVGDIPLNHSATKQNSPVTKPSIFQQLGALNIEDDRVQFV